MGAAITKSSVCVRYTPVHQVLCRVSSTTRAYEADEGCHAGCANSIDQFASRSQQGASNGAMPSRLACWPCSCLAKVGGIESEETNLCCMSARGWMIGLIHGNDPVFDGWFIMI